MLIPHWLKSIQNPRLKRPRSGLKRVASRRNANGSQHGRPSDVATVFDVLEKRLMLTELIGIDFGLGTTQTNWSSFSGNSDTSINNHH